MAARIFDRISFRVGAVVIAGALLATGCSSGSSSSSSGSSSSSSSGAVVDIIPETFSFASVEDAERETLIVSEAITVSDIEAPAPVAVTEPGEYQINDGEFTSAAGTVEADDEVRVRLTSAAQFDIATSVTINIGGVTADFTVTTEAQDISPDAFTFMDETAVDYGTAITSTQIAITGINDAVAVSITGGEYQIDDGEFTSQPGSVTSDQTIAVRVTSAAKAEQTTTATITLGEGESAVESSFSATTKPDTVAPEVAILFPPPASMTEGETIFIRGESADLHGDVASITINGEPVTTEDNFATWSVELPVVEGENTLTVTATDQIGNANADESVQVRRAPITNAFPNDDVAFIEPYQVEIDYTGNEGRLLVSDASAPAVVAVELHSGVRSIFLSNDIQDKTNFDYPIWMHAGGNGKLYITESFIPAILEVDVRTRSVSVFEDKQTSEYLTYPTQIVLDDSEPDQRLLIADGHIIHWVDIETGASGVFEDADGSSKFANIVTGMTLEKTASRLFVVDFEGRIYMMNLSTGGRVILAEEGISSASASAVALDQRYDRLITIDDQASSVLTTDKRTGTTSTLSSLQVPNDVNALAGAWGLAVSADFGYAFVVDKALKAVMAIDLLSGHRVVISKSKHEE